MVMRELRFQGMAENEIVVQHAGQAKKHNNDPGPGEFFIHIIDLPKRSALNTPPSQDGH